MSNITRLTEALVEAVKRDQLDEVKDLVSRGADPKSPVGKDGQNAIQWAAFNGSVDLIEFFVEELGIRDHDYYILWCALEFKYSEVMEYLSSIEDEQ